MGTQETLTINPQIFAGQHFRGEDDLSSVLLEVAHHLIDRLQYRDRTGLWIDLISRRAGATRSMIASA
jgi:hypothetical protein